MEKQNIPDLNPTFRKPQVKQQHCTGTQTDQHTQEHTVIHRSVHSLVVHRTLTRHTVRGYTVSIDTHINIYCKQK